MFAVSGRFAFIEVFEQKLIKRMCDLAFELEYICIRDINFSCIHLYQRHLFLKTSFYISVY